MRKIVVAVLFGGQSSEHDISKISAVNIMGAMSTEKFHVLPVFITKEGAWLLYDGGIENIQNAQWEKFGVPVVLSCDQTNKGLLRLLGDKVKNIPIDVVFPVLHGKNGEDGSVQGLCQLGGVPCVGASVLGSAVCMDKAVAKVLVKDLGVPQAKHVLVYRHELQDNMNEICKKIRYELGYPCFIKPANAGSSVGVSKANNKKELEEALNLAAKHDRKILAERAVFGRELECAVLGNNKPLASSVGEVVAAAEFYDYDAKYANEDSKTIVPADIPEEIADEIRKNALAIYKALDVCGMARVDFFWETATNCVVFNEINTIPGFTKISMYPMLWNDSKVNNKELVEKLVDLALERSQE